MASQKHLPPLDGIRGLAILIVLILHFGGGAQASNPVVRAVGLVIRGGWTGVTLFFVLSGFLISGILWDARDTPNWWRNFYVRRMLRIFPLYFGALLIVLVGAVAAGKGLYCLSRIWVFAAYLQNIPALFHLIDDTGSTFTLAHFWSLAVEEQFYLLWPLLLIRMKTLREAKYLCIAIFCLSELFRFSVFHFSSSPMEYNEFLFTRAGELALGGYLAMCYRDGSWRRVQAWAPTVTTVAFIVYFAGSLANHTFWLLGKMGLLVNLPSATIFFGGLLALSLGTGVINRLSTMTWLRWLGGISYGVYVFHGLLFVVSGQLALWLAATLMPHASSNAVHVLHSFVGVISTIAIAWLSFHYYERPFLRRRTKFTFTGTGTNAEHLRGASAVSDTVSSTLTENRVTEG